ncbi:BrxA/BrxB family bacilliredoxin [Gracilibacillus sp. S3-1-1]|uniref:BrxA/BrxB family bacilliredoxin n=1 Tax=Gracilibacillus pellucidus TaxID=3095368 RepID=A0ACC6M536_9BACI|nr:BrxA/BrxB family bacilliredoxin [Gracilibacillus sp. S3-1-1]MDX8046054.1 BrxA/BrxB family bacilliredoxin [Gracilibacillus sp. S3-1-1]
MEFNLYMGDIVESARNEMTKAGYEHLRTPEEVNEVLPKSGTTLVMINSTCGCAGGVARPAAASAIHYDKRPDQFVTVFAGQDREATEVARQYFKGYQPSSPSFALLKDGEILKMVERHEIEGHSPVDVVNKLQGMFDEYCEEV